MALLIPLLIMKTELQPTVLLVEDDIVSAEWYKGRLENEPIKLDHVGTGAAALVYLQHAIPAVILLDLGLPDMTGIDILKHVKQHRLGCAVIVVTVEDSIEIVADVIRHGAFNYIKKPFPANLLIATLRNALNNPQLSYPTEIYQLSPPRKILQYHKLIGACPSMQKVYQTIGKVAKSNMTVFITGETGTGKELCAEAIHQESQRKDKPFNAINCAAFPHDLLETVLFGYVKGAFTGADKEKPGVACVTDKGTLFLDEIGEMDLDLQSKLLRFLETSSFYKVGSHELKTVDIRFIAATNCDPYALVKAGKFREDLYYRLNALNIWLPPLRERCEDVLLIAQPFLEKYVIEAHKNFKGFAPEAEKLLLTYGWPGNVRQLLNVIRSMVLLNQGEIITPDMVLEALEKQPPGPKDTTSPQSAEQAEEKSPLTSVDFTFSDGTIRPFDDLKKDLFTKAVEYRDGNVAQAAQELGIGHSTVYKHLRKWNVPTKLQKKRQKKSS